MAVIGSQILYQTAGSYVELPKRVTQVEQGMRGVQKSVEALTGAVRASEAAREKSRAEELQALKDAVKKQQAPPGSAGRIMTTPDGQRYVCDDVGNCYKTQ